MGDGLEITELMDLSDSIEDMRKDSNILQAISDSGNTRTQTAIKEIAAGGAGFSGAILHVASDTLSTEELIDKLQEKDGVLFAEPNYTISLSEVETEEIQPEYDGSASISSNLAEDEVPEIESVGAYSRDLNRYQYAFSNGTGGIDVPNWNTSTRNVSGADMVVAVIDTGVDSTNEDLQSVMWSEGLSYPSLVREGFGRYGINVYTEDGEGSTDTSDVHYHGTHVAGIIAGAWNGLGISGVANGCRIMAVRAFNKEGTTSLSVILRGINAVLDAKSAGVNVTALNCSFGSGASGSATYLASKALAAAGIVSCWASGNESIDTDHEDSSLGTRPTVDGQVVVNSSDYEGNASSFTNYGRRKTDVFSPGNDILSTVPVGNGGIDPKLLPPVNEASFDDFEGTETRLRYSAVSLNDAASSIETGVLRKGYYSMDTSNRALRIGEIACDKQGTRTSFKISGMSENSKYLTFDAVCDEGANSPLVAVEAAVDERSLSEVSPKRGIESKWGSFCFDTSSINMGPDTEIKITMYDRSAISQGRDGKPISVYFDSICFTDKAGTDYRFLNGTSMATPSVTGMAAVLASAFPGDSAGKRAARIIGSVKASSSLTNLCRSGGVVNLRKALDQDYVPVIGAASIDSNGKLHVKGYFFGNAGTLSLGDQSISTESWTEEEIIGTLPTGFAGGEREIRVTSSGKTGKRILEVGSGAGLSTMLYNRLPLPESGLITDFSQNSFKKIAVLDDTLYFLGEDGTNGVYTIWSFTPDGDNGTWKKVSGDLGTMYSGVKLAPSKGLNIVGFEGKLYYIVELQLVSSGARLNFLVSFDPAKSGSEAYSYWNLSRVSGISDLDYLNIAGSDDRMILVGTRSGGNSNAATYAYDISFDSGNVIASRLCRLNAVHLWPTLAAGDDDIFYCMFGYSDTKAENEVRKHEKIVISNSSASASLFSGEDLLPSDGLSRDGQDYSVAADGDTLRLVGPVIMTGSKSEGNLAVDIDNFVCDTSNNLGQIRMSAGEKRLTTSRIRNPIALSSHGRTYFFGETDTTDSGYVFSYTGEWTAGMKEVEISGLPFKIRVSESVVFNGKAHSVIGAAKKKHTADIEVNFKGEGTEGITIRKVKIKNTKNANMDYAGNPLQDKKKAYVYLTLGGAGETYNKLLKKNPIEIGVRRADVSRWRNGSWKIWVNSDYSKVKKVLYTYEDGTKLNLNKKDYTAECSERIISLTGRRNLEGSVTLYSE